MLRLLLLGTEGLHHTHARENVLQAAVGLVKAMPLHVETLVNVLAERDGKPEGNRHEDNRHDRELPVHHNHIDDHGNHSDDAGEHSGKCLLHESSHLCRIADDAVHELAGTAVLNERERQQLDFLVEHLPKVHAHLGTHGDTHPVAEHMQ